MFSLIRSPYGHEHIQVRYAGKCNSTRRTSGEWTALLIVRGKWARSLFNFHGDPSKLGIVTSMTLKAHGYDVMILTLYWPIKANKADGQ